MKPALCYVIFATHWRPSAIHAVTSRRGRLLYARDTETGALTHRSERDVLAMFETLENAKACQKRVLEAQTLHRSAVLEQDAVRRQMENKHRAEIAAIIADHRSATRA
jgi:hypothetical protein